MWHQTWVKPVWVDYAGRTDIAVMRIGGMSIIERILREARRAGAERAIVRGDQAALPALAVPGLDIAVVPVAAAAPADARLVAGDVIAGVAVSDEPSRRRAEAALLQT